MFQAVAKVLLHTIIIDIAFFCCIYIFGNRKQIIQYFKKNWLIIILGFGFTFWVLSIVFACLGIKNDSKNQSSFSVETLYSCYVAIVIGAITLYFTVFSFTKPKKMAFVDYEKYVLNICSRILHGSIGISLFVNTLIIF
jgi:hypothetical protein